MRKLILDKHSEYCENSKPTKYFPSSKTMCEANPTRDIFYFNGEFIYFEFYSCNCHERPHEFVESTINYVIQNSKNMSDFSCSRSWNLNNDLKESRLRGIKLKYTHTEVNYFYYDASGKKYAVVTEIPYSKAFSNNEKLLKEYDELKEFLLKSSSKKGLLSFLKDLKSENFIYITDEEIVKSVEHMRKLLIKNN